jgi:hypothetical protein
MRGRVHTLAMGISELVAKENRLQDLRVGRTAIHPQGPHACCCGPNPHKGDPDLADHLTPGAPQHSRDIESWMCFILVGTLRM